VLVVDLDPQGNATTGFGVSRADRARSSYDLLMGDATLAEARQPSRVPGLTTIASTVDLSGAEVELAAQPGRANRLKDALRAADEDFVLIDCPPSLGLLTLNALVAADAVLVPLQCEFFALEGLSQLLGTVDRVRAGHNPRLEILGVVLTMFDRRNRLSEQVAADVRACLGAQVFETVIPRNVRLSEAPSHGLPALLYDHRSSGSEAYMQLTRELLRRTDRPARAA
jgi:chromosome partitioning protein